ncbi:MAG: SCP2 sterol-binding domain-containing protein [Actinomycetota bacterium]
MDALLFLSDAWLDAVNQHLGAPTPDGDHDDEPEKGSTDAGAVTVRYAIDGGPEGTGPYDLVVEPGEAPRAARPRGEAQVTLTMHWELAVAINQGSESAQRAVLDGRIMIGGDPQVLVDHQDLLRRGNAEVARLRATTVYS